MTRFLAVLVIIALLWMAVRSGLQLFLRSPTGRQLFSLWRILTGVSSGRQRPSSRMRQEGGAAPSKLVRCSVCETHVLAARCFKIETGAQPRVYCSEACLRSASSTRSG